MTCNLATLLGDNTAAAHDRTTLLCAVGALGREVDEDTLIEHMRRSMPSWTWEVVIHIAADLADGGALERVRNGSGDVIGWRITDVAAAWLAQAVLCSIRSSELARAPAWMLAFLPTAPKPTTTSTTRLVTP